MYRREFFQKTLMGSLAGAVLADKTLAAALQAPAQQAPAAAPATPAPTPRKLILDAYSRNFHWLRTADEMAEAAIEITCGGVMPTVGGGGAHVDAAKVTTDLPALREHDPQARPEGEADTRRRADRRRRLVESLVGTMGQLGVTHYWLGTDNYDLTKPILPQLDAIKLKVEKFVALNQKHGTTLMYHTRAGASSVGSVVWDLLYVLKDFDPKQVGFHWDTGHMALHGPMWETLMRTAGPYVVGMSWKDRSWAQNLGFAGETGPYPGPAGAAAAVEVAAAADAAARRRLARRARLERRRRVPLEHRRRRRRTRRSWRGRCWRTAGGRCGCGWCGAAGDRCGGRLRQLAVAVVAAVAAAVVVARRPEHRSRGRWRATRSRAAAHGTHRRCPWARAWSTSSSTRRCFTTSASTDRWNSKPNTRGWVVPRAARPS